MSNTHIEKMGTGKLISLIGTGMDVWVLLLDKIINNTLKIVSAFCFTLYTIWVINVWFAAIFIVFYSISHLL